MRSTLLLLLAVMAVSAAAQTDVCKLVPDAVIAKAQGSKPVAARATSSDTSKLHSSQCFYELSPFAQSVSLQVISRSGKDRIDVREFWKSRFHAGKTDDDEEKSREVKERRGESEERERPGLMMAVKGVGEEAYWVDTGRDGALYALAGEHIVRISIGGSLAREQKIARASTLAQSAVAGLADSKP